VIPPTNGAIGLTKAGILLEKKRFRTKQGALKKGRGDRRSEHEAVI
jgi:hypothetical protein